MSFPPFEFTVWRMATTSFAGFEVCEVLSFWKFMSFLSQRIIKDNIQSEVTHEILIHTIVNRCYFSSFFTMNIRGGWKGGGSSPLNLPGHHVIWNYPEHIIYIFRHFWLDFMLFLTSKLLKNVNFGLLDHFGQRVLTTCVWYDQIHFGGL